VVLDTNVVVSALLFGGGVMGDLRAAWQGGACMPLTSTATAQELLRVLAYPKFGLDAHERNELLADYLPYAVVVPMPKTLPTVPACRDPFDVPFLQLAVAGKARWLVSGDKDLLALTGKFAVPILAPTDFLACL
jgi:putative PIN family toxin of toxin-antitoxin system